MESERPLSGILIVVGSMTLFSCSDAISKSLTETLPPLEVTWFRWLGYLVFLLPSMVMSRGRVLVTGAPFYEVGRALGLLGSSMLFIYGLRALPLATASTINFVSPMFVTLLSIPLLGEKVGARRWAAVFVGFVGVLIVVRPGAGSFDAAAMFPLLSALCWAFGVIFTRKAARSDGPVTAMAYTALVGFAVLSPMVVDGWVSPTPGQWAVATLMAAAATAAQFGIALAYRRAPASLLAPFSYSQIIGAATLGYLVFGNVPGLATAAGAAIIIASGLYTAHRERIRTTSRPAVSAQPQAAMRGTGGA